MTPIPVHDDPLELFNQWFAEAKDLGLQYPNACTLASVDEAGQPHARIVLLKGHDARGFVFYTNFQGGKGRQLLDQPRGALCFYWEALGRQFRVAGAAAPVSDAEADAYFASRPRLSQVGAWASHQSQEIEGRHVLEQRVREIEEKYEGQDVPRPPHWSGFRIAPERLEFWKEGEYRLHDRLVYTLQEDGSYRTAWLSP